jgi:hypothetical protein
LSIHCRFLDRQHQQLALAGRDRNPAEDVEGFCLDRLRAVIAARLRGVADPEQIEQQRAVGIRIATELAQPGANLLRNRGRRVVVDDLAKAAQQVEHQQIGDRGAIGDAPAFVPVDRPPGERAVKFGDQPRFADAGFADDPDRLPVPRFGLGQQLVEHGEFPLAADKNPPSQHRQLVEYVAPRQHLDQPER